jgi:hypothetical protein
VGLPDRVEVVGKVTALEHRRSPEEEREHQREGERGGDAERSRDDSGRRAHTDRSGRRALSASAGGRRSRGDTPRFQLESARTVTAVGAVCSRRNEGVSGRRRRAPTRHSGSESRHVSGTSMT